MEVALSLVALHSAVWGRSKMVLSLMVVILRNMPSLMFRLCFDANSCSRYSWRFFFLQKDLANILLQIASKSLLNP